MQKIKIRAYIRLQRCRTNTRMAFVCRTEPSHGIAKGPIRYYAVEGSSWAHIRRVLKTFEVMGHSACDTRTVCAYVKDIGTGIGKLWPLLDSDVPEAARYENVRIRPGDSRLGPRHLDEAPELTSFGIGAIEVLDSWARR